MNTNLVSFHPQKLEHNTLPCNINNVLFIPQINDGV